MHTEEWFQVLRRPARLEPVRTADDVSRLGTVLGIWAHPDDEAYLSGGLMAAARDHGSRVVCVTATRGELGTSDPSSWPASRLAAQRTVELEASLQALGVTEHRWLDYPDGGCEGAVTEDAVARLAAVIGQVAPRTVLTFGPDGFTGHADHQVVSSWATAAFDLAAPPGARLLYAAYPDRRHGVWGQVDAEYDIYPPGYPVLARSSDLAVDLVLEPAVLERKVGALRAQTTQTAGLLEAMGAERYTAWVAEEAFVERVR